MKIGSRILYVITSSKVAEATTIKSAIILVVVIATVTDEKILQIQVLSFCVMLS